MKTPPTKGLRVVVVEDEALIAEEIRGRLQRLDCQVAGVADTGADAIALAEREKPDLVLMDIRLKGKMDGIEAADQIYRRFDIPIVYLTAHSDVATIQRAKATGQFGYVLKPFQERDLFVAIEMAVHRHKLDQSLQQRNLTYAALLASITDGVIAADAEGQVRYMNPVAEALTGWKLADAEGLPAEQVFHILQEPNRTETENPVTRALRRGPGPPVMESVTLLDRDGMALPIEQSAARVTDVTGRLTGAVVAFRDIRERRRAEEERGRLRALVESSVDAVIGRDLEGVIVSWNPAAERVFGYMAAEAIGKSGWMLVPPDKYDEESASLARLRRGERIDLHESTRFRKDGSLIDVLLITFPVRDHAGNVIGAFQVVRDV